MGVSLRRLVLPRLGAVCVPARVHLTRPTPSALVQVGIETMAISSFAMKIWVVDLVVAGAAEPQLAVKI